MAKKTEQVVTAEQVKIEQLPMAVEKSVDEVHMEHMEDKGPKKLFANQIELGTGCHMLGKSLTLSKQTGAILELTQYGITATSKTGRVVLIPWPNVRCLELQKAEPRKPGAAIQRSTFSGRIGR